MSTGFSTDTSRIRSIFASSDARSALIATGLSALLIATFYFLSARDLFESARKAEETRRIVDTTDADLKRMKNAVDAVMLRTTSITKALESGDANAFKGVQAQIQTIDSSIAQLADKLNLAQQKAAEINAEKSARRANAIGIHDLAHQVDTILKKLKNTVLNHQKECESLFADDDLGRRVAADPQAVRKVRAILAAADIGLRQCNTWERQLGEILPRITRAHSGEDPTAAITEADEKLLQYLLTQVTAARDHWLATENGQDVLLRHSVVTQPSTKTLSEAIDEQERSEADDASDEFVARMSAAQAEERQRLGELLEEYARQTEKIQYDIKLEEERRAQLKAQEAHHKIKHENDESADRQKRMQLERELVRDLPTVKQYLRPFIAHGYTFTGGDGSKGPVSLSELRSRGALEETRQGLERLLFVGGSSKNDRDRGAFPMFIGGENGWRLTNKELLTTAQQYLIKYGELLVERQLLAE